MANDFYNFGGYPSAHSAGTSAGLRNELANVATGFDKFPLLTGNGSKWMRINAAGTAIEVFSDPLTGFYLPITGGTLTGGLTGTSAVFSGSAVIGAATGNEQLRVYSTAAQYAAKIENQRGDATGKGLWVDTRWNVAGNIVARFSTNNGAAEVLNLYGDQSAVFAGSVGVGGAPSYKLDVLTAAGSIVSSLRSAATGVSAVYRVATGTRAWQFGIQSAIDTTWSLYDETSGNTRLVVDSAGRIGVNTLPSSWNSAVQVIEFGNQGTLYAASGGGFGLASNVYWDAGGNWRYRTTAAATYIDLGLQVGGGFNVYTAASGTAGTVPGFVSRLRLTQGGTLEVGNTNIANAGSAVLVARSDGVSAIRIGPSTNNRYRSEWYFDAGSTSAGINAYDDTGGVYLPLQISGDSVLLNFASGGNGLLRGAASQILSYETAGAATYMLFKAAGTVYGYVGTKAGLISAGSGMTMRSETDAWIGSASGAYALQVSANGAVLQWGGGSNTYYGFQNGSTLKGLVGVSFSANQLVTGSTDGDLNYRAEFGRHLWSLDAGTTLSMKLDGGSGSSNLTIGNVATGNAWATGNRATCVVQGATSALLGLYVGGNAAGYIYHAGSSLDITNNILNVPILFQNGGATRMSISYGGVVDITAGSGNLTVSGHKTRFESAEQALSTAAVVTYSVSHGGTRVPDIYKVVLRCKIAEGGYNVGDEVEADGGNNDPNRGTNSWANASSIGFLAVASSAANPGVRNTSTGANFNCTTANWRLVFKAIWL